MTEEIGAERYDRFLLLRMHGRMGPIWVKGGSYALSVAPCYLFDSAEQCSVAAVCRTIDYWYPGHWTFEIQRRPARSEIHLPKVRSHAA